jgi:outer membrane protein
MMGYGRPMPAGVRWAQWARVVGVLLGWGTAVLLCGATAAAQLGASGTGAPDDSLRLSLDAAIARALDCGEEMQAAQSDLDATKAIYVQTRATALPQLHLSSSYTRQIESVFQGNFPEMQPFEADTAASDHQRIVDLEGAMPTAGLSSLGAIFSSSSFASENTWMAGLTLSQKVFEGGSIWHSIAAARNAMGYALNAREDRRSEVILGVRLAYLAALVNDRGVRIAELSLEQAETQLERVRLSAEAGQASEYDQLQAEVARDNQIPVVREARNQRDVAYLELCRLVNLPASDRLVLVSPILEDAAIPADPAAVDTTGLVAAALRAPAIVALEEALSARKHAVPVAASGHWPALSLFASLSQQAYPQDVAPVRDDWVKDVRAGAEVSWSLFDGLRTSGAVQESKARRDQASQALLQTREFFRLAVIKNEGDLARAAADLVAQARTVQLAARAHELATLRFEEGASDQLEVNIIRIAYQVALVNEARARHDYFATLARLERYSAQPLFSNLAPSGDR